MKPASPVLSCDDLGVITNPCTLFKKYINVHDLSPNDANETLFFSEFLEDFRVFFSETGGLHYINRPDIPRITEGLYIYALNPITHRLYLTPDQGSSKNYDVIIHSQPTTASAFDSIDLDEKSIFFTASKPADKVRAYLTTSSNSLLKIKHSSFFAGADVACAGECYIDSKGIIKIVNQKSGHYRPSDLHFSAFRRFLQDKLPQEIFLQIDWVICRKKQKPFLLSSPHIQFDGPGL
ncbi:MAG: hypothetical protein K0S08_1694 [Gammaproteobacteria bacterium]|jgi:hypothetical protein|nr:hypothetical protein [Gammaproteobacteria bacterium]